MVGDILEQFSKSGPQTPEEAASALCWLASPDARLVLLIDIRRVLTLVDEEQWRARSIIATLAQIALLFHPVVAVVSALL